MKIHLILLAVCAGWSQALAATNIGNYVWRDLDRDGRQDGAESGLAGVVVQLWNSTKTSLIDSDTTSATGVYQLTAPDPGNYRVRVVLPDSSYSLTAMDAAGGDNTLDSDFHPSGSDFGFTDILTVAVNVIAITTVDAGLFTPMPVGVGSRVWSDTDGDGLQDVGEPGAAGVTVQLWNSAKNALLDSSVTSANGNYTLTAPDAGDYRVRVLLPLFNLDSFSPLDAGANDTVDSDINPSGADAGFTNSFNLAPTVVSISSIDAGLMLDMAQGDTIGNRVFLAEATGLQPAADASLAGLSVTVELLNAAGVVLESTLTSRFGLNRGYYGFAAPPGTYRLRFVSNTNNFIPTPFPNAGGEDTLDSDINDEGLTPLFTLAEGGVRRDLDAGFVFQVNVGNSVWRDTDADGVQDVGEPGVPDVVVELWDAAKSRRWTSTNTNSNGIFSLRAPGPGNYRLWVLRPHPGDSFSPLNVGGDDTKDSDVLSTALDYGFSEPFALAPGVIAITSRDAGLIFAAGVRTLTPLRITSFSRSPPGLTFTGPAGGTYQVERSTGLSSWIPSGGPVVTVNASHAIALPLADMAGPGNFWRVRRTK